MMVMTGGETAVQTGGVTIPVCETYGLSNVASGGDQKI